MALIQELYFYSVSWTFTRSYFQMSQEVAQSNIVTDTVQFPVS